MKLTKQTFLFFLFSILWISTPSSWSQETLSLGNQLFKAMKMEETMNQSMKLVAQSQSDMALKMSRAHDDSKLTPQQKAIKDQFTSQVMIDTFEFMMKEIDFKEFAQKSAAIYDSLFTAEELQQMIAFYQSPVGQKLVAKTPEITALTSQMMGEQMIKIIPKLQEFMKSKTEKLTQDLKMTESPQSLH